MDSVLPLSKPIRHMKRFRKMLAPFNLHRLFFCTNASVGAQNTLSPFFELVSQIILCVVLDRMLSRHLKTQHAQVNHGLQSMRQFALTKMYIDQYYDQP